jgi:hypothetical protein
MLNEEQLETLRARHVKIGVVEYSGHQIVFRRPSRDQVRDYRRKQLTDEKVDALDQLAQATIVAFDGEEDVTRARTTFTTVFLEEYPSACNHPKFMGCLSALSGLVEVEDEQDLGKGVSIRNGRREPSPKASPNGSDASSTSAR